MTRIRGAAHELRGRDLLRMSCDVADDFVDALALRGGPLSPQTTHLLKLLQRYGAKELNTAMAEALARGAVGAASVGHILDTRRRRRGEPPPLETVLPDDPRVRDQRVAQHSLAPYDRLLKDEDDNAE